jgi:hypothetical protein
VKLDRLRKQVTGTAGYITIPFTSAQVLASPSAIATQIEAVVDRELRKGADARRLGNEARSARWERKLVEARMAKERTWAWKRDNAVKGIGNFLNGRGEDGARFVIETNRRLAGEFGRAVGRSEDNERKAYDTVMTWWYAYATEHGIAPSALPRGDEPQHPVSECGLCGEEVARWLELADGRTYCDACLTEGCYVHKMGAARPSVECWICGYGEEIEISLDDIEPDQRYGPIFFEPNTVSYTLWSSAEEANTTEDVYEWFCDGEGFCP